MTFLDHPRAMHARLAWLLHAADFFERWQTRRQQRNANKRLVYLPDHLLRDVGLEHLIDYYPQRSLPYRLL